jgi:hypothetical protein
MLVKSSVIVTTVLFLLHAAPCGSQERIKLRVSSATKTLGYGPLWIASKMGFFERQGLDVDLVVIRASDVGIQALAGGSLEIAGSSADAPIAAVEKGLDLVMVGGIINGLTQSIMAAKKYKTYADLRGATFGAISLTSGVTFALRQVLKVKGLEYPRDYKLLVIGGTPQTYAALTAGQIDAAALSLPVNYAAEEQGFNDSELSACGVLSEALMGREKPAGCDALLEGHGSDHALDLSKQTTSGGFPCQRNEPQTRSCQARLGVLYGQPHVASRRRYQPGRPPGGHPNLRRTNPSQRSGIERGQIYRSELS